MVFPEPVGRFVDVASREVAGGKPQGGRCDSLEKRDCKQINHRLASAATQHLVRHEWSLKEVGPSCDNPAPRRFASFTAGDSASDGYAPTRINAPEARKRLKHQGVAAPVALLQSPENHRPGVLVPFERRAAAGIA